jgi:hypothetical protein
MKPFHISLYLPLKISRPYESLTAKEKLTAHEDYRETHLIRCRQRKGEPVTIKFYAGTPIKDVQNNNGDDIPFQINLVGDANERENCTKFTLDVVSDEQLYEDWLVECIEYIEKKLPSVKYIIFNDVMEDEDNLMRSIALNGQSYLEMFFNVMLHCPGEGYLTHEQYEDKSMYYVSEEFKMEYSWSIFLTRYPLIAEYEPALAAAYRSSKRIVDFMRQAEDILPTELFYELCKEVVAKEYGKVSRSWVYDMKHVFLADKSSEGTPHCCACEGCFDNPKGCPAGFKSMSCFSSDSESDVADADADSVDSSMKLMHSTESVKSDLDEADLTAWHHSPPRSCHNHSDHE